MARTFQNFLAIFLVVGLVRQVHLIQRNQVGLVLDLVVDEEDHEEGHAHVGNQDAFPVPVNEGVDVLATDRDQAENEGEDRPEGEEERLVLELGQRVALLDEGPPEAEVGDRDPQPGDEAAQPGGGDQVVVGFLPQELG